MTAAGVIVVTCLAGMAAAGFVGFWIGRELPRVDHGRAWRDHVSHVRVITRPGEHDHRLRLILPDDTLDRIVRGEDGWR